MYTQFTAHSKHLYPVINLHRDQFDLAFVGKWYITHISSVNNSKYLIIQSIFKYGCLQLECVPHFCSTEYVLMLFLSLCIYFLFIILLGKVPACIKVNSGHGSWQRSLLFNWNQWLKLSPPNIWLADVSILHNDRDHALRRKSTRL